MTVDDRAQGQKARMVRIALDLFERLAVIGLFALLAIHIFGSVSHGANPVNFLFLVSEGLVVALVMVRRPASELSVKPMDWFVAFGASAVPTLLRPGGGHPIAPVLFAGGLMLLGLVAQVVCKLTLMRSFGIAPANRGLVVRGPYGLVRHPIYASYLISQTGFLLLNPTLRNLGLVVTALVLQLFRIDAEERLLAHDPSHAAYSRSVRYRLVPGLY